jgi:hypothetical protein
MSATAMQPLPLPPPDRVSIINRSVRCFIFGVVGVFPCVGLGMVVLVFRLYRDIAAETGEPVKLYPLFLTSVAGVCVAAVCFVNNLPDGILAAAMLVLGLQLLFLRRQYLTNAPVEWNPARHLMYWGLALAHLGLILSAIVVLFGIYAINHS